MFRRLRVVGPRRCSIAQRVSAARPSERLQAALMEPEWPPREEVAWSKRSEGARATASPTRWEVAGPAWHAAPLPPFGEDSQWARVSASQRELPAAYCSE